MDQETKKTKWYQVVLAEKLIFNLEATEATPTEHGHYFYLNEKFVAFIPFTLAFFKIENPND